MKTKAQVDYSFVEATIHFKPWKGKIERVKFYYDESKDLHEYLDKMVKDFRNEGLHKRRIITAISITWPKNIRI